MYQVYISEDFIVTTDPKKIDVNAVCELLSRSYWSEKRNREIVEKFIENSLCFSLYYEDSQIGFARVVTDYITFGYIRDVFIHEDYRGKGLGKWLINCVITHPDMINIERLMLATKDAQTFYQYHGFGQLQKPEAFMERLGTINEGTIGVLNIATS
ncbi:GNAT family N-acetyltransferase [Clostridium tetani]|uniref:N-acetyltransferase n=1 Tax=Clostridium tetani TaxID=1513 RepID=A0ABY0EW49_CLOTA|nr:GNAT family N-acetyltransferase [Clostridium tetani]RXI58288.1 N-acetyltransferase [Clostridium tetani]